MAVRRICLVGYLFAAVAATACSSGPSDGEGTAASSSGADTASGVPSWLTAPPSPLTPDQIWTYTPGYDLSNLTWGPDSVDTNPSAGQAIVHYSHEGHQFVNNINPGTMMQPAVFWFSQDDVQSPLPAFVNPTMGGDDHGHGAVPLYNNVNGDGHWLQTQTAPLDYGPDSDQGQPEESSTNAFNGVAAGDAEIFWNLPIGQFLELGVANGANGATASLWQPNVTTNGNFTLSNYGLSPGMFLRANFDTINAFDATNNVDFPVPLASANCGASFPSFTLGQTGVASLSNVAAAQFGQCAGIIASDQHGDADQGYAVGLYGCSELAGGGTVATLQALNAVCPSQGSDETSDSTVELSASFDAFNGQGAGPLAPNSTQTMNVYVVSGRSVADVEQLMQEMAQYGYR